MGTQERVRTSPWGLKELQVCRGEGWAGKRGGSANIALGIGVPPFMELIVKWGRRMLIKSSPK